MKENKIAEKVEEQVIEPEVAEEVPAEEVIETEPKKGFFTRVGETIDKNAKTIATVVAGGALAIGGFALGRILGGGCDYEEEYSDADYEALQEAKYNIDDAE